MTYDPSAGKVYAMGAPPGTSTGGTFYTLDTATQLTTSVVVPTWYALALP